jgi:glycosyltransferase involved in cell wall biosynthesis
MDARMAPGTRQSIPPGIDDIQQDPFCLDSFDPESLGVRPRVIVSNEPLAPMIDRVAVQSIQPPSGALLRRVCAMPLVGGLVKWLTAVHDAVRLVFAMRRRDAVGLISLGHPSGSLFCLLNSFGWLHGGPVVAYRLLVSERLGPVGRYFLGRALRNVAFIAVWSRVQIENYHRTFGWPREKFVFIPYKANHSQPSHSGDLLPVGDYLFSGGNSERDYRTLFEAVRGLPIPVVVSATKPGDAGRLTVPENVIFVRAEEPAFERLLAGSRLVALCVKKDIFRGAGEATVLNAMWHGKAVVAADDVSAADYIEDGIDGFIVPAGSVESLRRRIQELWENPGLAARMGEAARRKVAGRYTHHHHKVRMQALACVCWMRTVRIDHPNSGVQLEPMA